MAVALQLRHCESFRFRFCNEWHRQIIMFMNFYHYINIILYLLLFFSASQVMDIYIQPLNERYYMLMMLIPLVSIILIRNLKLLAPFSQGANIITFVGLAIVLWYIFTDLPPISSRPLIGEPRKYTLFVGTTLFALEAVGVVSFWLIK